MISTIDHLVRPNIRALKPYRSARQDHVSGILLDANENAFGSSVTWDGVPLNRYPDPAQRQLRDGLAEMNGV
ncbi:MAG: histidinol-phosphate transaminase, partial [Bacteroidetes bacterium]|nr:histidinol-phosphate transaminase [Bacteroidota bacterium]